MKPLITEKMPTVARINVTPSIDVALVLVIILLITAPMMSVSSMEIDLPEAKTRSIEDEVRVSITVDSNGRIAVDEDELGHGALVRRRGGVAQGLPAGRVPAGHRRALALAARRGATSTASTASTAAVAAAAWYRCPWLFFFTAEGVHGGADPE